MNVYKIIKRYRYFLILSLILTMLFIFNKEFGLYAFDSFKANTFQMLSVLPPAMLILGLIDEWIPREHFMKYMGNSSKVLGVILSFTFAFLAAGPMYAGFPFAAVLMKKGVKFSTLLFEIGALGFKYSFSRLIINIPAIIIMGYIIDYLISEKPHKI